MGVPLLGEYPEAPKGRAGPTHEARPWGLGAQPSEKAQRVGVVADQQALGLLVVLERHLVVFA
ncbi:MAG: hypothetical protein Q4F13_05225, partial [Pseudomonadota bacterium]|nr:hypothetical protein [Pseudomonadota bacterium]